MALHKGLCSTDCTGRSPGRLGGLRPIRILALVPRAQEQPTTCLPQVKGKGSWVTSHRSAFSAGTNPQAAHRYGLWNTHNPVPVTPGPST
jgi:hypothetical protein